MRHALGASLAAGAEAYRRFGSGAYAETAAIVAVQRILESFRPHTKNVTNCVDIVELDWQDIKGKEVLELLAKGGPIGCFRLAARYAPDAYDAVDTALSEELGEIPSAPVSCAAVLAQ